jgi:hypothetical protein
MRGIVSAQMSPGARTCVVVGSLEQVDGLDLASYQSLLWFAREGACVPERFGVTPARLVVEPVERADSTRIGGAVDRLIQRDAVRLPSVILTEDAVGEAAGQFLPVVETILAQCESHLRARLTRQRVGFLWQTHLLANLRAYADRRVPAAWAGALQGVPAFVCGSGPSLDASAAKLAAVADRGLVLAADSALGALARLGVAVDFAVSIDATKTPEKCLRDCPPPAHLVLASVSPPEWRDAVPADRVCYVSGNQMTEQWLAEQGVYKTTMSVQGNCGITAVELAVFLGCSPIYLFGMDNAVDGKGSGRLHQQHFNTALLGDERFRATANYPKVPGNYQEEIATPFLREWRMLDTRCAELPAGSVTNVIDRGARLRNTTLLHPDDFSLAAGPSDKALRLAALAPLDGLGELQWRKAAQAVQRAAGGVQGKINEAWTALHRGDQARAVRLLADAFQNAAFRSLMGNYGLKVMPHLVQPSGSVEFWKTQIAECRSLIALTKDLG